RSLRAFCSNQRSASKGDCLIVISVRKWDNQAVIKRWKETSAGLFIVLMDGTVAFHSRRFAFHGAGGEPPRRQSACGISPVPLIPQESARLLFQSTECIKRGLLLKNSPA
ncbi:hypothetical protein, partial [Pseudobacillus badius]|uniref:hypothetical protein n=1 Tax=Bacillus badius TaxID=1455 RepID=UPI001C3F302E